MKILVVYYSETGNTAKVAGAIGKGLTAQGRETDLMPLGDIAADGSAILVRTYVEAHWWHRRPGQSVAQALGGAPCRVPLRPEPQGESIAWATHGNGYYTVSEGSRPDLYYFERRP